MAALYAASTVISVVGAFRQLFKGVDWNAGASERKVDAMGAGIVAVSRYCFADKNRIGQTVGEFVQLSAAGVSTESANRVVYRI